MRGTTFRTCAALSLALLSPVVLAGQSIACSLFNPTGAPVQNLIVESPLTALPMSGNTSADECVGQNSRACKILAAAQQIKETDGLKSVILRVAVNGRPLITTALGHSMRNVPATTNMHFRIGAVAIAYMSSLSLQLQDAGIINLDDTVKKWLPDMNLPNAGKVTLRMLLNNTSGYRDYVTTKSFQDAFYCNVFRQWQPQQLIDYAMSKRTLFAPGGNFNYAHTNFVILGLALESATKTSLAQLIRQRIIRSMNLPDTANPNSPDITAPALHAFTKERGFYEEGTFWNPSWTLAKGAIMTGNIFDMERSARIIGMGGLISQKAYDEMLAPTTAGMGQWTDKIYYGLGILSVNGWVLQNPSFHGYAGIMGYLPEKGISVAIMSTKLPRADVEKNYSQKILTEITKIMSPGHIVN